MLRQIINEEINVARIENKGQFGYIMQMIMGSPNEPISDDLYDPIKGKLILRKGESFNDISPRSSHILLRYYNIDTTPDIYISDSPVRRRRKPDDTSSRPAVKAGPSDVQTVASALSGYVRGGSPPLRNDVIKIVADSKRGEIAVYLRGPSERMASDQQIACALRYLLDEKISASGRYIVNPCGFGNMPKNDLIVIVKL